MLSAACIALAGCANVGDASKPLPQRTVAASCARPVDTLLVLLPGAYDHAEDFVGEGFVDAVRSRHIAADIALVDASVSYYRERNIVARLDDEVIRPARARGIQHVWLAGISIGGLGSLIEANERRNTIDGLLLIAPYLGEPAIVAEIEAAGGLTRWRTRSPIAATDDDRRLWHWLQVLAWPEDRTSHPTVYLGFGTEDRFVAAHRLFAAALPADHVFTAPGNHDWPPWKAVWNAMLDAAPLPHDATCRTP